MNGRGDGKENGCKQPMKPREIHCRPSVGARGERPIKLGCAEDDRASGGDEAERTTEFLLLPARRAAARMNAFRERLSAFRAAGARGQAVQRVSASFAEHVGLGRDDWSDARHWINGIVGP